MPELFPGQTQHQELRNLFTNPSFELGTAGWSAAGGTTNGRSTDFAAWGGASFKWTNLLAGDASSGNVYLTSGAIAVKAGQKLAFRGHVRHPRTATGSLRVQFIWNNGVPETGIDGSSTAGAWVSHTALVTVPEGATSVTIRFWVGLNGSLAAGDNVYADALMLTRVSPEAKSVPEYFDGSLPGYEWDGAPHASTSRVATNASYDPAPTEVFGVGGAYAAPQNREYDPLPSEVLPGSSGPYAAPKNQPGSTGIFEGTLGPYAAPQNREYVAGGDIFPGAEGAYAPPVNMADVSGPVADFFRLGEPLLLRTSARILVADPATLIPTNLAQIINLSTFDAQTGWSELGVTRGGVRIARNVAEDGVDVWHSGMVTTTRIVNSVDAEGAIADMSLSKMSMLWDGSVVELSATEKRLGGGVRPVAQQKRVAILHPIYSGKQVSAVRAFVFAYAEMVAAEQTLNFAKSGEQQTLAFRFRSIPDPAQTDPLLRHLYVLEAQV